MADQVQVQGARNLERTMHRAADELQDMEQAHGRAGDYVAGRARALAPRRSGRLAGSVRAESAAVAATITAGGPGVPYAGPIHYGWAARNIAAQPFLTDALEQSQDSALNIYGEAVDHIVARIKGK